MLRGYHHAKDVKTVTKYAKKKNKQEEIQTKSIIP